MTTELDTTGDGAPQIPAVALAASVVLPTHGRRRSLLRVLRALDRQQTPVGTFEAVVICDGDVDGSADACEALAPDLSYRLHVLRQHNQGPAAARNAGVAAARADLIVFLDDDVVPDERLIALHLAAHRDRDRLVTIGPLLPPQDAHLSVWCSWEERVLCEQYQAMAAGRWQPTWRQFYTGNAALRRELVLEAGGFDPVFRRAEDVEFALRLHQNGVRFSFLSQARGWHHVARSFQAWLNTSRAYGQADAMMAATQRPWILAMVAGFYQKRSAGTRMLTELCATRALPMHALTWLLGIAVRAANAMRIPRLGEAACGVLFNISYYDALAGALGGRDAFVHAIVSPHRQKPPADVPAADQW